LEIKLLLEKEWNLDVKLSLKSETITWEPRCHCKKTRKSAAASGLPSGQICKGPGLLLLLPLEEEREEVSGSTFEKIKKALV
jgi:hypothetical protein